MEKAPWKLTKELVELLVVEELDPNDNTSFMTAPLFIYFKSLVTQCLISARKHANEVSTLMRIMSYHSAYPAFRYNSNPIGDFMSKLMLHVSDSDLGLEIDKMMLNSYDHIGTNTYDHFQVLTNGIAK